MKHLWTIAILLFFQGCKQENVTQSFDSIELFSFNGWNQTKAFRIDSLGEVQILTINLSDSSHFCFSLNQNQLDTVKSFADSSFKAKRNETIKIAQCDDCPIDKAIITRGNKKIELNSERSQLPKSYSNLVSYLMKVEHQANKDKCVDAFNTTELSRGYKDLFRIPFKRH